MRMHACLHPYLPMHVRTAQAQIEKLNATVTEGRTNASFMFKLTTRCTLWAMSSTTPTAPITACLIQLHTSNNIWKLNRSKRIIKLSASAHTGKHTRGTHCKHFSHDMQRKNVVQLACHRKRATHARTLHPRFRPRIAQG